MVSIVRILCTPFALVSQRLCILLLDAKRLTISCNSCTCIWACLRLWMNGKHQSLSISSCPQRLCFSQLTFPNHTIIVLIPIHLFLPTTAMVFKIRSFPPKLHHSRFNASAIPNSAGAHTADLVDGHFQVRSGVAM